MEEGDSPGDGTDLSEQGDQSSGTSVDGLLHILLNFGSLF